MKKLNKKGFTLVEILAVTIILLIIFVIAFNAIDSISKKSKIKSVKANALSYFKELNSYVQISKSDSDDFLYGKFTTDDLAEHGFKISGTKPTGGYFVIEDFKVSCGCLEYGKYKIERNNSDYSDVTKGTCNIDSTLCTFSLGDRTKSMSFEYTGTPQIITIGKTGRYQIELWGAQGGGPSNAVGGKGAYTSGKIDLQAGQVLYVYVGSTGGNTPSGSASNVAGGYNGGGATGGQNCCGRTYGSGGGATDVRLVGGDWNDAESLNSRIMVAAGGGGGYYGDNNGWKANRGGAGGTLVGIQGSQGSDSYCYGEGGKQTEGGYITENCSHRGTTTATGSFGTGGTNNSMSTGGGGGYWGGSRSEHIASAGGGSSYISGYKGCIAILSDSDRTPRLNSSNEVCEEGTNDIVCSYHYSGKKFVESYMFDGNSAMPTHDGESKMVGNTGNGFAKISVVENIDYDD